LQIAVAYFHSKDLFIPPIAHIPSDALNIS